MTDNQRKAVRAMLFLCGAGIDLEAKTSSFDPDTARAFVEACEKEGNAFAEGEKRAVWGKIQAHEKTGKWPKGKQQELYAKVLARNMFNRLKDINK